MLPYPQPSPQATLFPSGAGSLLPQPWAKTSLGLVPWPRLLWAVPYSSFRELSLWVLSPEELSLPVFVTSYLEGEGYPKGQGY